MLLYLRLYAYLLPVFLVIDRLWLAVVAAVFDRDRLGHLLADEVNWSAALIFYALYIAGIRVFSVIPGLRQDRFGRRCCLRAASASSLMRPMS